jgi:histidinol-phosphate aminotransferase
VTRVDAPGWRRLNRGADEVHSHSHRINFEEGRMPHAVSRRRFVGGLAAAVGYLQAERPAAQAPQGASGQSAGVRQARPRLAVEEYDAAAKLAYNENPYGPSEAVMKAMTSAFKYDNRYSYPDGNIVQELATHHGVKPENILLAAGSGEILQVADRTFLPGGRKVVGVTPTFGEVYEYAAGVRSESITLPLRDDYGQDIGALVRTTRANHRDVGFVYVCTPNNPTGVIVTKQDIRQLLDGIPEDVPVVIDEAYHHYVETPDYATSIPYVLQDRPVIVARTFSKVYGLAGMRLGYAVAPKPFIDRMRPHCTASINALVKWAGVAALRDTATADRVRTTTLQLRRKTTAALEGLGFKVLPSEANFFMVHIRRPVQPVIEEFRKQGVLVGRPFPPMLEHLRVSVGTAEEMERFLTSFRTIVGRKTAV